MAEQFRRTVLQIKCGETMHTKCTYHNCGHTALHAKYKQTREPVPDGQDTKFVYSTQLEKDKFKKMSQDRIQYSSSLKPFSRLPYTYGEFGNGNIYVIFCTKILLMCLSCAGYYEPTYHVMPKSYSI